MALKGVFLIPGSGVEQLISVGTYADTISIPGSLQETSLYALTLPARTFETNGDSLAFEFAGVFDDGADTQFFISVGGAHILISPAAVSAGQNPWVLSGRVLRSADEEIRAWATLTSVGGTVAMVNNGVQFDPAASSSIQLSAQSDTTGAVTLYAGTLVVVAISP